MQPAEYTISELSDLTEQVASGIGDIDLQRFQTALNARFTLLHGILHKKVRILKSPELLSPRY